METETTNQANLTDGLVPEKKIELKSFALVLFLGIPTWSYLLHFCL